MSRLIIFLSFDNGAKVKVRESIMAGIHFSLLMSKSGEAEALPYD